MDIKGEKGRQAEGDLKVVVGLWGLPEAANSYRQAKNLQLGWSLKQKTQVWEEFDETMERDFQFVLKKFWQILWQLRRVRRNPVHTVFTVGGEFLTSTESIVHRWKEYFNGLFDPTNTF